MYGIVARFLLVPIATMDGDDLVGDKELDRVDPAHDGELLVGMLCGNRIIVAVESDQRQRIRVTQFDASCLEIVAGKRQEKVDFFEKQLADRLLSPGRSLVEFFEALLFQPEIEGLEVREFRDRNHVIVTGISDPVFDVSLLLRLAYAAEMMLEKIMRFEAKQSVGAA